MYNMTSEFAMEKCNALPTYQHAITTYMVHRMFKLFYSYYTIYERMRMHVMCTADGHNRCQLGAMQFPYREKKKAQFLSKSCASE